IAALFVLTDLCGRRCHRDHYLIDRAGEFVVTLLVVLGHRRREVFANVFGLIGRKGERDGILDSALGHLFPIHVETPGPSLTNPSAIVNELKSQRGLACRNTVWRLDRVVLLIKPVVAVLEFAVLHVQAPAREPATLRENHALSAFLRYLDLGGDGV